MTARAGGLRKWPMGAAGWASMTSGAECLAWTALILPAAAKRGAGSSGSGHMIIPPVSDGGP
jgi:hypothetical protein